MNNRPFKIGDRVVCIDPMNWKIIKKGQLFTVKNVVNHDCGCCSVFLEELASPATHCHCFESESSGIFNYKCFALAQPRHESADIAESIIEQARELIGVSETVAPVHQPVNN
jgi:hypothetical protein